MLKWAVTRKSTPGNFVPANHQEESRPRKSNAVKRLASESGNTPKRRRFKTVNRRCSLASHLEGKPDQNTAHNEKENRHSVGHLFSPTYTTSNPLRDVSNFIPSNNPVPLKQLLLPTSSNVSSLTTCDEYNNKNCKCKLNSKNLKDFCFPSSSNYPITCYCNEWLIKEKVIAPTLPSLAAEDSPCISRTCRVFCSCQNLLKQSSISRSSLLSKNSLREQLPNTFSDDKEHTSVVKGDPNEVPSDFAREAEEKYKISPLEEKFFNFDESNILDHCLTTEKKRNDDLDGRESLSKLQNSLQKDIGNISCSPILSESERESSLVEKFFSLKENNELDNSFNVNKINIEDNCKDNDVVEEELSPKGRNSHPNDIGNVRGSLILTGSKREYEVSSLVEKLFNLNFTKASLDEKNNILNNSSLINNLSLDDIVNAVLETPTKDTGNDRKLSAPKKSSSEKDNEINEHLKANRVNSNQEERVVSCSLKSSGCHSIDSGFSGTFDKQVHEPENNFKCKCQTDLTVRRKVRRKNLARNISRRKKLVNYSKNNHENENTLIELNSTFNERSIDVNNGNTKRKRNSVGKNETNSKRFLLENSSDTFTFTLRRQKCIRRRKTISSVDFMTGKKLDRRNVQESSNRRLEFYGESDFKIYERRTCKEEPKKTYQKKSRRCLDFYSPNISDGFCNVGGSSTPKKKNEKKEIRETIDLECRYQEGILHARVRRRGSPRQENCNELNYLKIVVKSVSDKCNEKTSYYEEKTWLGKEMCGPSLKCSFEIPIKKCDFEDILLLELWLENSERHSEFLGSSHFSIKDVIDKSINGACTFISTPLFLPSNEGKINESITPEKLPSIPITPAKIRKMNSQSTNEEIISLEEHEELSKSVNREALNEQQREADENVFLRYLELDPMEGPEAIPAATQRKATGNKSGRTPFTSTKVLTKVPKTGFGFSVVWTHPPRVERIEKASPAEKAGMMPGDYIIFVDKHNVVMMPEVDILNLIKSCGNQLTLEIFRRNPSKNGPSQVSQPNKFSGSPSKLLSSSSALTYHRASTVGSTHTTNPAASVDCNRKRLHLPQVTFSSEKTINDPEEPRRKVLYQIISKEQTYITELQFGTNRFLFPLAERKDIINPLEHRVLFQNMEEILKISEDILDNIVQEDGEQCIQNVPFVFFRKLGELTVAYRKYCSGLKKADCVLADRTKHANSGFVRFLQTPLIPRKRPDITAFIHKPLQHYRDILNLFGTVLGYTNAKHEDYNHLVRIVKEMQLTYRNITKEAGFMEPGGEGRLLLSVQDLENRLVFTKCKPFVLSKPGRHWIFGGELFRVEGRNIRQYWTLLFTDILLFAKVSRDRVLFITEEPLPLSYIVDIIFTVRKKSTEFRLLVQPGGVNAKSPTVHCGLDITKAPRKQTGKRCIVLRAPNIESKAIWQNLLQRQIFRVNSGMESSTFSSPLESPEVPLNFSAATLQSTESLNNRRQNAQYSSQSDQYDPRKQIHELIEHKCKQLGKTGEKGKGTAIHLEHWMKNQLTSIPNNSPDDESINEIWSEEQLRKRTQELLCGDSSRMNDRNESRCERMEFSDVSPSKSTSFESQVTVKSSPVGHESVKVCQQCQKTCLNMSNNNIANNNYLNHQDAIGNECSKRNNFKITDLGNNFDLVNTNHHDNLNRYDHNDKNLDNANIKNSNDPFLPIPQINVNPPTPDMRRRDQCKLNHLDHEQLLQDQASSEEQSANENNCSDDDDDESQDNFQFYDEQPYHVLSKSNPNLRRYGTLSSLKKLGSQEIDGEENSESDDSEKNENDNYNHSTIRSWTSKAGAYVSEKISFFEKLGEDYKTGTGFFERYLRTTEVHEDECENSAATSGEDVWGTPTSGGDLDDPSVYSNCDGQRSLSMDSGSSDNDDDAELMMDELLMTPPVASVNIRGLLPRTTLEPLMEEDSDTCTSSSSSSTEEQSPSSKQGNETGTVADDCSIVVKEVTKIEKKSDHVSRSIPTTTDQSPRGFSSATSETPPRIHRSESYRNIIDAEDDGVCFFRRLSPTLVKIENVNKSRSIRLLEILNVRKGERKIYETFPTGAEVIKLFSKEGSTSQEVPTAYGKQPPFSPKKPKDKPSDKRFWRQLSRRRGSKPMDSGT